MGKETGGKKMEDPNLLKSNEMAQFSFQPQQPRVCDTFKNCEDLSRVAVMAGNGVVMLGKVVSRERKGENDKGCNRQVATMSHLHPIWAAHASISSFQNL